MKKILLIGLIIITVLITGCSNGNIVPKTEFVKGEQALLDDIYLTLNEVGYQDDTLTLNFKIENKTKNTITIIPDSNFKLYDINQVQIKNTYSNNTNVIKKNEIINYTLEYNIDKKEIYDVYFYSGIVENNIKFNITSGDIN